VEKKMVKRSFIISLLVLALALSSFAMVTAQDDVVLGPVTQRIIDRGELICGGNANLTGFGVVNDAGEFSGFDIDVCRAVAVAVLGDANALSVRPLTAAERQAAIQGGEIDLMVRNTTWTLSRDSVWGATFGPTTFYDGQGIGTRVELGITTLDELDGASICVQQGTTTELNITDAISARGLDIAILTQPDAPATWEAYESGRCEAWTTDISGIISFHAGAQDPGEHMILDEVLSKEPLGPLSPQNDPQFADIVAWTVFGLITAEELGITSENIGDFMDSEDPVIQRFLGLGDNASGSYLGISNDFMVQVITQIGNYGEIFDRNLGPLNVPRGVNALWTDGGLLYAPPFR
jgi:general L-amino acid transport system substrate-binding protein